jgi:hypothetical protein
MTRIAATTIMAGALALAAPGVALARGHHHHHHTAAKHAARAHHARVERLAPTEPAAPASEPSGSAGKVVSFEEGVLTLELTNGKTVSGAVNGDTEIKCEVAQGMAKISDHGGGDGSGDREGSDASGPDGEAAPTAPPAETKPSSGEDEGGPADDDQDEQAGAGEGEACGASMLVPGAPVREAELRVSSSGSTFKEIELVG